MRLARSSVMSSGITALPLMAIKRPRIIGYQSKFFTPPSVKRALKASPCSGCTLITKRLGASGGVAWRQLLIRSVRSNTNSTSASKPTLKADTCSTAKPGRAAICRVASTNQRGAALEPPPLGTKRASKLTAAQLHSANSATAAAKPPTAIRPNFKSLATAINSATKPKAPAANTAIDAGFKPPTSRRITRSGGTCDNCNTGGKPKPSSKVAPTPKPNSAGHKVGAGNDAFTNPASNHTNT